VLSWQRVGWALKRSHRRWSLVAAGRPDALRGVNFRSFPVKACGGVEHPRSNLLSCARVDEVDTARPATVELKWLRLQNDRPDTVTKQLHVSSTPLDCQTALQDADDETAGGPLDLGDHNICPDAKRETC